ncbi:hypothetical protein [Nocardiopsis synnemataformans]|uniref:hypothetical protein n=1 Tax=Nocardiopsis synnemataformans TaxID=61305 RepID=UPI003EBB6551
MAGLRSLTQPPHPLPHTFRVDGHTLTVPAHPTRWWVRALAAKAPGCWWSIIPAGLDREDMLYLVQRLDDSRDAFDLDHIETLAEKVIGQIMGMDLWAVHRLMSYAYSNWVRLEAWCWQNGAPRLLEGHPASVASAVYAWRLSAAQAAGSEQKARQELNKLDTEVWGPPPMHMHSGNLRDVTPQGWEEKNQAAFKDF